MPVDDTENDVNAAEAGDDDDLADDDQEVAKILSVRPTVRKKKERPVSSTSEKSFTRERGTSQFSVYAPHPKYKRSTKGEARDDDDKADDDDSVKEVTSTFGKVAILKVVMFDLAVSFGDAVTDILQGVYLIIWHDEKGVWRLKEDTWHYGLWVLVVCWVPGLVCVIHILTHYR